MTKVCKKLFLFICFAVICLTVFCSCDPLKKIDKLSNIEWRDDKEIFKLRASTFGTGGCGTITLNGETYEATYEIWTHHVSSFRISLRVEDAQNLNIEGKQVKDGIVEDYFTPIYNSKDRVITSETDDVELFGVKIGKVRLKAYDIDMADFKIWEILSAWEDRNNKLYIENYGGAYTLFKCMHTIARLPNGRSEYVTLRWLSETPEFRIYEEFQVEDYKTITDETPYLAAGSFEYDYDTCKITLNFTEDELLGLQGQSLELAEMR